ncbi:unnamed protein product [Urochloa humidicola]
MPPSFHTLTIPTILLILAASAVSCSSLTPEDGIRIVSAEKRIDLTGSIVKVYLTLKVENAPGASDASRVLLAFTPTEVKQLAILKATRAEGKRKKKTYVPLSVEASDLDTTTPNGAHLYSVQLGAPLKPVLLSPYHVLEQVTYIKTPSNRIESFTRVDPTSRAGTEVKYGTYKDQVPNSYLPILVHYENNQPFAVVEELVRKVEISHWGNVQITEHYKLKHGGARHKGVFSRLEYQSRPSISGASSFKNLLARLPPRVHSVYYRDEIGNISTSHLRIGSQKSELEIEPRYPLFGGWHCTFTIGYGLPLQDFLFESDDGRRYVNLTFGCPLLDTVVDDLTIKVVLPEGSKNPQPVVPFVTEKHLETSYSYLDVVGRTTVVLKKKNVVGEHNVPFQVYYEFNPIFMLAEPLMLISAALLFFVSCIAYLHMDLSIGKSS